MSTGIDGIDERLAQLLEEGDVVEEDEIIPPEELEESEAAKHSDCKVQDLSSSF